MLRWTDPDATPAALRPCVATFGNFDGVHRGHRVVIETLIAQGAQRDLPVVVLTFDPHPVQVLHPERAPELISPGALHEQLLEATGIDGLLVVDFTAEYAQQSAADFIVDTFVHGTFQVEDGAEDDVAQCHGPMADPERVAVVPQQ